MRTQHPHEAVPPPSAGILDAALSARPGRLLAAEEVAQLLGVSVTLVYALARRGDLPTVRIGERYVRFRPGALAQWIEARESTQPKGTR